MEIQFKYACYCTGRRQLSSRLCHQARLEECVNDMVDRSWDEADDEILSLMTFVLHNIRNSADINEQCVVDSPENDDRMPPMEEHCLAILRSASNRTEAGRTCICAEISENVSIVLDAGLSELNVVPFRPQSMLEKIQLLRPFVEHFEDDVVLTNFFNRSWKQAVRFNHPSLIEELAHVYPQFLKAIINALLDVDGHEHEMLHSRIEFKYLSRCLTVGASFYVILSYCAEQDRALAQPLVSACIRATKQTLGSRDYFNLFPSRLRPYAVIMNEIMNPSDPDVDVLINQLKKEHPLDHRILIMISPVFCCLENEW